MAIGVGRPGTIVVFRKDTSDLASYEEIDRLLLLLNATKEK